VVDEVMYEVTGKYISVKHGDIQLAGSNLYGGAPVPLTSL